MAWSGRDLRISRDGVPVVGAQSDDLTLNGEPVDVTDKDDNGWRTMLGQFGVRSVSGTVAGVLKDATLAASLAAGDDPAEEWQVQIGDIAALNGLFRLPSFQIDGETAGAIQFTAGIESSGAVAVLLNTVAPAVTGTAQVGETLTTTLGTWVGSPSLARQWQANDGTGWVAISGATGATYTIDVAYLGDTIRCRVTGTTAYGTAVAYSNSTVPVIAA
jgi:predicted secreted protein